MKLDPKIDLWMFTHIPKCAGNAVLENLVLENLDEERVFWPKGGLSMLRRETRDFQYIKGHWPFGAHRYINRASPARHRRPYYFTALREPVDQMISFFYYRRDIARREGRKNEFDCESIVAFFRDNPRYRNIQTKMLAGPWFYFRRSPVRSLIAAEPLALAQAKKHLKQSYHDVFFQHTLAADITRFAAEMGVRILAQQKSSNVSGLRPKVSDLGAAERDELARFNQADLRLFAFARKEWER